MYGFDVQKVIANGFMFKVQYTQFFINAVGSTVMVPATFSGPVPSNKTSVAQ